MTDEQETVMLHIPFTYDEFRKIQVVADLVDESPWEVVHDAVTEWMLPAMHRMADDRLAAQTTGPEMNEPPEQPENKRWTRWASFCIPIIGPDQKDDLGMPLPISEELSSKLGQLARQVQTEKECMRVGFYLRKDHTLVLELIFLSKK